MMGWNNTGGWGAGHWFAMSLMMIVVVGLLVAAAVWVVSSAWSGRDGGPRPSMPAQGADEVLSQRFARGEIDEQEFTNRRAVLHPTDDRSSPTPEAS